MFKYINIFQPWSVPVSIPLEDPSDYVPEGIYDLWAEILYESMENESREVWFSEERLF